MNNKLSLTLLTGFLGAGKTTLLQGLVKHFEMGRIAVVENEFGPVGVDSASLSSLTYTLFDINDGCVCCSVKHQLKSALLDVWNQRQDFDHVVIETTGLADPSPILKLLESDTLSQLFDLNGVVTVVDAQFFERTVEEIKTCREQVAYADLVILNKVKELNKLRFDAVLSHLQMINPVAMVIPTDYCHVDPSKVLKINRDLQQDKLLQIPSLSQHDESIRSVVVMVMGEVNVDALDVWLGQQVRRRDIDILRIKGVLSLKGFTKRFIFNGVRDSLDVKPGEEWGTESRYTQIVLIGRGLDQALFQADLERCRH